MIDRTMTRDQDVWALTDLNGRVETISTAARRLFGVATLGRGDDLLEYFPLPRKALLFDIEIALTGWPTKRSMIIRESEGRLVTLQYRVSRRLEKSSAGGGLYWHLHASTS